MFFIHIWYYSLKRFKLDYGRSSLKSGLKFITDVKSGPSLSKRERAVTPARQAAWRLKEQMLLEENMKKKNVVKIFSYVTISLALLGWREVMFRIKWGLLDAECGLKPHKSIVQDWNIIDAEPIWISETTRKC